MVMPRKKESDKKSLVISVRITSEQDKKLKKEGVKRSQIWNEGFKNFKKIAKPKLKSY